MRSFYSPKMRDFIFKFYGNLLGINTRVSHFNNNIERYCTFCKIQQKNLYGPIIEESFEHLFYSCPATSNVLTKFFNKYMSDLNLTETDKKKFIFTGVNPITGSCANNFLSALAKQICFYIWECKLKKTIPMAESLYNDVFFYLENMRKASCAFSKDMNSNLLLCRCWPAETSQRP
jgi:hypothetical protein